MSESSADFVVQMDAWIAKATRRTEQVPMAIAEAALKRVKELTPVDTGFLRANWSIVLGGQEVPVIRRGAATDTREGAGEVLSISISHLDPSGIIRIVNPVEYARPLEYGYTITRKDGTTRHVEGRGMATQTVAELPEIAARVIRQLAEEAAA